MAVITETRPEERQKTKQSNTVGAVKYVQKPKNGEELFTRVEGTGPNAVTTTSIEHDERQVDVHDIRTAGKEFSLRRNGFELHKINVPADIDWSDDAQVAEKYYPVVEALLKKAAGVSRVHIFHHTTRKGHLDVPKNTEDKTTRNPPVGSVHIDFNKYSGGTRLFDYLDDDEADVLKQTPYGIIQVWRPLKGPVRAAPLGLIDAATVKEEDLVKRINYQPHRTARTYAVHYSPDHKWYYAEGINTDEAYVFVCYDSRLDRARFTPHTAFKDLSIGEDAPPRESVEIRAYVFWEHEGAQ